MPRLLLLFVLCCFLVLGIYKEAAAQDSPAGETVEFCVEGTVIDAVTNQPIPDAEIQLFRINDPFSSVPENLEPAKTDHTGHFNITWIIPKSDHYTMADPKVVVYVDGYANNFFDVQLVDSSLDCNSVKMMLKKGAFIEGVVRDEMGNPLEGVEVRNPYATTANEFSSVYPKPVFTDPHGKFILPGLYPGLAYRFILSKSGYVTQATEDINQDAVSEFTMETAASPLTVIATRRDSKPLSNFTIISNRINPTTDGRYFDYHTIAKTDENGRAVFSDLKPGDYYVSLFGRFISENIKPPASVTVFADKPSTFEYQLEAPMRVRGNVFNVDTQEPVAGIEFRGSLMRHLHDQYLLNTSVSDESGNFNVLLYGEKGLSTNIRYNLPEGYLVEGFSRYPAIYIQEFVPNGEQVVEVALQQGVSVHLKILGNIDQETKKSRVIINDFSGNQYFDIFELSLKEPEGFLIPPNQQYNLTLSAEHSYAAATIQTGEIGTKVIQELELKPYGAISGRVTLQGQPVVGLPFTLQRIIADNSYSMATSEKQTGELRKTNENGEFRITKVFHGNHKLRFMDIGYEGNLPISLPSIHTIEINSNEEKVINIDLEAAKAVLGQVTNKDGLPLEGATVQGHHVYEAGGGRTVTNQVKTNHEGQFTLVNRADSEEINQVQAYHPEYFQESAHVVDGMPLSISLFSLPQVEIQLKGLADEASIMMSISDPIRNGGYRSGLRDWLIKMEDKAPFRIRIGRTGQLRAEAVELDRSGNRTGRIAVTEFEQSKETPIHLLTLDFSSQTTFSGIVTDQHGNPLNGAKLYLLAPGNRIFHDNLEEDKLLHQTSSDSEGKFIFEQVQPADYELNLSTSHNEHFETIIIPETGLNDYALTIKTFNSVVVTGVVTGPNGNYLGTEDEAVHYVINSLDGKNPTMSGFLQFPENSRFKILDVPFGNWEMTITYSDKKLQDSITFMADGDREEVTTSFSIVQTIELTGTITINGEPWNGKPELLISRIGNRQQVISLGEGKYKTHGIRGAGSLMLVNGRSIPLAEFEIPEEATSWEHHFELNLGKIVVELVAENSNDLAGLLAISNLDVPPYLKTVVNENINGEKFLVYDYLKPGNYEVQFTPQRSGKTPEPQRFQLEAGAEKKIELLIGVE
jgi:protocatechuate 3,4-dioxygenase beta subunit